MWRTLSSRVYVCIAASLALALIVSAIAIVGLRDTAQALDQILDDNLPSVIAAWEIDSALLEQRGYIATYIVSGGDNRWLNELEDKKTRFRTWLKRAESVAFTLEEQRTLNELAKIADQYDAKREKAIESYRAGRIEEAKAILLGEVNQLYQQAYFHCNALNTTNQRLMRETSRQAAYRVDLISAGTLVAIILLLGLSGFLLTLFYRDVLRPLRQMAADLQQYLPTSDGRNEQLRGDVESVATYLRLLLMDVADFQTTLESQRRALFDAQKMASVGRLAASLAHEIRNPLTAMKMWLFSAREAVADRAAVAGTIDSVAQEVRRLENIVRQFLEFSRPTEVRLATVGIRELVADSIALVEPLIREKDIAVRTELTEDLPDIFVDRLQMIQVLVNLVRNSAESVSNGGTIVVSSEERTSGMGETEAVLSVRDDGPGIPSDQQAKVFEPFFTTKEEGTGLGLAIVQSIVFRHGGRVEVRSPPEGGAKVSIHLPLPRSGTPGDGKPR